MKFDDKILLAKTIKLARIQAGLTQAELAEKVGISTQHISRIESACYIPSLKTFFEIVQTLNIDLRIFGFNTTTIEDKKKTKLVDKILSAKNSELIFYENIIDSVDKSLELVKKSLF